MVFLSWEREMLDLRLFYYLWVWREPMVAVLVKVGCIIIIINSKGIIKVN